MYGGLIVILCPVFYWIRVRRHAEDSTGSWNSSCTISTCVFESLLPYSPNTLLAWRISTSAITHGDHFSDGEGKNKCYVRTFVKVIMLLSKRNVLMCMVTPYWQYRFVFLTNLWGQRGCTVPCGAHAPLIHLKNKMKKREKMNKVNQLHISGVLNAIFFMSLNVKHGSKKCRWRTLRRFLHVLHESHTHIKQCFSYTNTLHTQE